MSNKTGKPNFLIILVDEQRFPPPYEDDSIKEWRKENLKGQNFLCRKGIEFNYHYTASNACVPSRATLYTGQYPSLHGVTQTDGAAKTAFDPGMFWLDPNTVPTFGDYLRTAGYDTFWKGKWHVSHADIIVPGTQNVYPSYNNITGVPLVENEEIYLNANRLDDYGFDGWIGPEPHGSNPRNSASSAAIGLAGRDEIYSEEVVELIERLQDEKSKGRGDTPWAIVASFVNPHDIVLFGAYTRLFPLFNFEVDESVPPIPPAPTANENLDTKPTAQASYRTTYHRALQPLVDSETYRRFYYSLQLKVDKEVNKVINALKISSFYNNTIIIYTSDHGDLLGAHGGLFQKWYQAYEESIHVPLIIHNPRLAPEAKSVNNLTSHVDILPTILGLAGIDPVESLKELKNTHTEAHPLVGRDLTPLILEDESFALKDEVVYFMTDDDVTKGLNQVSFLGRPYESVVQPNHIETVICRLETGRDNELELWKYSRYFDNPLFSDNPDNPEYGRDYKPDEIEMYNLTVDPLETQNLANPEFSTNESSGVEIILAKLLAAQCKKKRIYPSHGDVPGKLSCRDCTPDFGI